MPELPRIQTTRVESDRFVVLLSCGHWTQTRALDGGGLYCQWHETSVEPARDGDVPAVLTSWDYDR